MSTSEKKRVEKVAADRAVAKLRTTITAEANDKIRTKDFVNNVVRDLKKAETARLTPIVKADILKNLEKELKPTILKKAQLAAKSYVDAEKSKVLKILHAALVQKNKLDLLPKMNAKLSKTVPAAIASPKFEAKVAAASLLLKAKIKAELIHQLEAPMKKVTEIQMAEMEKEKREEITTKVRVAAAKRLAAQVQKDTATSKLMPVIQKEADMSLKQKIHAKVSAETKNYVDNTLAKKLKAALFAKYEKGTLKQATAQVKMNQMDDVRNMVKAKLKTKAETAAKLKIVAAKIALRKTLTKDLTEKFYEKYKQDNADKMKALTKGMSLADKKSTELMKQKEWKASARVAAEKQAEVELAGEKGEQLEKRIMIEEKNKAQQGAEKETEAEILGRAKKLSAKTLEKLYKDDKQAMEAGKSHVAEMAGKDKEKAGEGPNVAKEEAKLTAKAAEKDATVQQIAAAAGAVPKGSKPAIPSNATKTEPVPAAKPKAVEAKPKAAPKKKAAAAE